MVYLLKMVIFHGELLNNQMVLSMAPSRHFRSFDCMRRLASDAQLGKEETSRSFRRSQHLPVLGVDGHGRQEVYPNVPGRWLTIIWGVPQMRGYPNSWFTVENPPKMNDLGVPESLQFWPEIPVMSQLVTSFFFEFQAHL